MSEHDGGPAFPHHFKALNGETMSKAQGMSLRDYFAAKAMQIMWDAYDKGYCGLNGRDEPNVKTISEGAYQPADAMLRAREAA